MKIITLFIVALCLSFILATNDKTSTAYAIIYAASAAAIVALRLLA